MTIIVVTGNLVAADEKKFVNNFIKLSYKALSNITHCNDLLVLIRLKVCLIFIEILHIIVG